MSSDGQYLAKLQDYYARHRVLPSYSAICELVGLNSKASVADMVLRLKAEGFLESTPGKDSSPGGGSSSARSPRASRGMQPGGGLGAGHRDD